MCGQKPGQGLAEGHAGPWGLLPTCGRSSAVSFPPQSGPHPHTNTQSPPHAVPFPSRSFAHTYLCAWHQSLPASALPHAPWAAHASPQQPHGPPGTPAHPCLPHPRPRLLPSSGRHWFQPGPEGRAGGAPAIADCRPVPSAPLRLLGPLSLPTLLDTGCHPPLPLTATVAFLATRPQPRTALMSRPGRGAVGPPASTRASLPALTPVGPPGWPSLSWPLVPCSPPS